VSHQGSATHKKAISQKLMHAGKEPGSCSLAHCRELPSESLLCCSCCCSLPSWLSCLTSLRHLDVSLNTNLDVSVVSTLTGLEVLSMQVR
jgi:hypothetical protein